MRGVEIEREGCCTVEERESLLFVAGDREGQGKALLGCSDGGAEGEKVDQGWRRAPSTWALDAMAMAAGRAGKNRGRVLARRGQRSNHSQGGEGKPDMG
jgi:hypothetical protein